MLFVSLTSVSLTLVSNIVTPGVADMPEHRHCPSWHVAVLRAGHNHEVQDAFLEITAVGIHANVH